MVSLSHKGLMIKAGANNVLITFQGGILSEDRGHQVSQVMTATRGVFEALQDLQTNFTSIILPESLKTVSQREPSVLAALVALEHIMVGAQRPMAELLRQLEAELLEAIMGIQVRED